MKRGTSAVEEILLYSIVSCSMKGNISYSRVFSSTFRNLLDSNYLLFSPTNISGGLVIPAPSIPLFKSSEFKNF